MLKVEKLEGPTLDAIHLEGVGILTRIEAVELAAQLVFYADGSLVRKADSSGVKEWNTESLFHQRYGELMFGRTE